MAFVVGCAANTNSLPPAGLPEVVADRNTGQVFFFIDAVPFDPGPWYEHQWNIVEACIQEKRDGDQPIERRSFDGINWFVAEFIIRDDNTRLGGQHHLHSQTIVLAEPYAYSPLVVQHELLHFALAPSFTHGEGVFGRCDPLRVPVGH